MAEPYYRTGSAHPAYGSWAIKPHNCRQCGTRYAVTWVLAAEIPAGQWCPSCPRCLPLGPRLWVKEHGTDREHAVVSIVREVPAMPTPDGPRLEMWMAEGLEFNAKQFSAIAGSFAELGPTRIEAIRRAKTPPWSLYRDEDGRVWAPRDPVPQYHGSETPLPLRPTTIGKRRWPAQCFACKSILPEGSTAWMPDAGDRRQWSSSGLAIRFCTPCVHVVPQHDEPEPDGGERVRHLRVFEGARADQS